MPPALKALSRSVAAPLDSGHPREVLSDAQVLEGLMRPRDVKLTYWDQEFVHRFVIEAFLLLFLTVVAVTVFFSAGPLVTILGIAAFFAGANVLCSRAQWHAKRIIVTHEGIALISRGVRIQSLPFQDIKDGSFEDPKITPILIITSREGSLSDIQIPDQSFIFRRKSAWRSFVRNVSDQLPPGVQLTNGKLPEDKVSVRVEAAGYNLPAVGMKPGKAYRYADQKDFEQFVLASRTRPFEPGVFVVIILTILVAALFGTPNQFFFIYLGLLAIRFLWDKILPSNLPDKHLARAAFDRFELVEEGLKITRGDKTWILKERPQPANAGLGQLRIIDAPVLRFGRGLQTYYFDPRFIERDR